VHKLRDGRRPATRSNEIWAMDFVHDRLATGRKLRVLTIVDTFSHFLPALEPRFTFRGVAVVEVLEKVSREVGLRATSVLIKAPSLYLVIWICGRTSRA
jgi:putative transposase